MYEIDPKIPMQTIFDFITHNQLPVGAIIKNTDGLFTTDESLMEPSQLKAFALEDAKMRILENAESYRSRFLTNLPGKHQAYVAKATVARRIVHALSDGNDADPSDLEILQTEADARDLTPADLAASIVAKANDYERINGLIEGMEAGGLKAVEALDLDDADFYEALQQLLADLAGQAETAFNNLQT